MFDIYQEKVIFLCLIIMEPNKLAEALCPTKLPWMLWVATTRPM